MSDAYPGQLARLEDDPYDPWRRAAARVRSAVQPWGGRQGDPERMGELASAPLRAVAGFVQAAYDRAAEEHGGATQLSTDYDPRRMGALLGAETAMNVVGVPGLTGGVPAGAMGSAAKGLTGFAPGEMFADPKLRAKAELLRGTYPQYAEQYPGIGPPALKANLPDPNKPGKFLAKAAKGELPYANMEEALARSAEPGFFLEKKLTPEAEKFQRDRNLIQQDMDLHGYKPYFDPKKRTDVDPKHYGPFEDTAVTAAPKTAKAQAEWEAKYGTEEIRARLRAGFEEGKKVPESDRWYFMGQLEKEYVKELGEKKGREAFQNEFARMMGATTGGAAPYDNFLMSHYANVINKRGERLPERGYDLPFPISGRFASGNIAQAQKFIDEGIGNWPMKNPKRYDFSTAYLGNKNAGTIDEQMMTAFDPTLKVKQPQWYGPATKTLREEAAKANVDTRGMQDVGWAGLKKQKTEAGGETFDYEGPMINQINRSIETTHRLTGMPREEIVTRGLIKKEIPLYSNFTDRKTGATLSGLAAMDDYKPSGIKAWHASPHDFDKVDLSKIGTGQGAQSYGPGFYAAESPKVSGQGGEYWNEFLRHPSIPKHELEAAQILRNNNFDRAAAVQEVEGLVKHYDDKHSRDMLKALQSGKPVGPRVYELNLKADPRSFLQWDEPLSAQPEIVGKLNKAGWDLPPKLHDLTYLRQKVAESGPDSWYADQLRSVEAIGQKTGAEFKPNNIEDMARLRDAGIPGVRYLDQVSRQHKQDILDAERFARLGPSEHGMKAWAEEAAKRRETPLTYNYVVNNPEIIEIMRKLAIPGVVGAGTIGELARQDRAEQ